MIKIENFIKKSKSFDESKFNIGKCYAVAIGSNTYKGILFNISEEKIAFLIYKKNSNTVLCNTNIFSNEIEPIRMISTEGYFSILILSIMEDIYYNGDNISIKELK